MEIRTIEEALNVLGEPSIDSHVREEARAFLAHIDPKVEMPQLVEALHSNNFKVRWEAAKLLGEMGRPAVEEILRALVDPRKVGDQCLRDGVYQVLRNHRDPVVRHMTAHLLQDLHGSAADLRTMHEANHLLQEIAQQ